MAFPFDVIVNKIIHPRRDMTIECSKLFRHKIEKKCLLVSLKIATCLLAVLLFNRNSKFTDSIVFLILSMCAFL